MNYWHGTVYQKYLFIDPEITVNIHKVETINNKIWYKIKRKGLFN